jgi:mutator protein MutT
MTGGPSVQNKVIRHGAYGVVLQDSKILLAQKKTGPYFGLWGLPGGGIEFGETPEQTLKRELMEEASIAVSRLELLNIATATGEYLENGCPYGFHQVGLIYRVLDWAEQSNHVPEEECRWASLNDLIHKELTPFALQAVSNLQCRR